MSNHAATAETKLKRRAWRPFPTPSGASVVRKKRRGGTGILGEYWQLFVFLAGLIAAWSVLIVAVLREMLKAHCDDINRRIDERMSKLSKVERDFLELKADLPLSYVRKEDFVRFEVVINAKLDRLYDSIERLKEKVL
jgi:hypothetical protein